MWGGGKQQFAGITFCVVNVHLNVPFQCVETTIENVNQ
jgi:hypothetical protein